MLVLPLLTWAAEVVTVVAYSLWPLVRVLLVRAVPALPVWWLLAQAQLLEQIAAAAGVDHLCGQLRVVATLPVAPLLLLLQGLGWGVS
jgi:hypothetical protein